MNKSISLERIFSLGDYQNIKFTDTITDIPETVMQNGDALKYLRYLQLVDVEWSYLRYMTLRMKQPQSSLEQAMEFIEEERTITFERLLESISKQKE